MFNIGTQELVIILLVVLVLFGAKRIPEVARALGKGVGDFREALSGVERELKGEPPDPRRASPRIQPPAGAPEGRPRSAPASGAADADGPAGSSGPPETPSSGETSSAQAPASADPGSAAASRHPSAIRRDEIRRARRPRAKPAGTPGTDPGSGGDSPGDPSSGGGPDSPASREDRGAGPKEPPPAG